MTKRLDDAKSHIKQAIGSVLHYLSKDEQQRPEIIAVMFRATCEKIGELGHDPRRAAKVFLTKLRGMASLDGLAIGIGDMISLFSVTVDGHRGLISRASGEMSVRCNKCGKVRTFMEDNLKEAVAYECCGETMGKKVAM